ncbi:hypothetical protein BDW59DRAFT_138972 [Aspergillus cavernicola]|uniref:Pentatricopeptide repeat-containing protein-mitochondrial domain-containing protein n=1 Tax=Aspergillus cavernicola TaxID=176166 RepID=A0ABR4IYV1_9EURO
MMSQPRLILDETWRLFCPAFRLNTLARYSATLSAKQRTRYTSVPRLSTCLQQRRNSTTARTRNNQGIEDGDHTSGDGEPESSHVDIDTDGETLRGPDVPMQLKDQTTPELETKLRKLASNKPLVANAMQILRLLIRDRTIHPEARHYKWLMQSNSDPERGSPLIIRRLLEEMEENGIPADSGTLHAVLQALAVHPDNLLRQDVLRALRDRWLPLSPSGWHFVVAGLIREHQFELALDHIANMERKDVVVKDWLHSLLIYHLCAVKEFDQVLESMRSRLSQGHEMTQELWMHVFDAATTSLHHSTTCYIWERMVQLGYLHLEHRLCTQALDTASYAGDTKLATSILRFLTHNKTSPRAEDFEKWSEAYARTGDLYIALEVLCEMHKAGFAVKASSTYGVMRRAFRQRTHSREVWAILKQLKSAGHEIPLACARVVIDLCGKAASLHDPFEVDSGIEFYKQLHTLCSERPDTATFNSLVRMCRVAKNTESAMFIVKEMAAFEVVPDEITYQHLILMCLECGNFESSWLYFRDLQDRGFNLSQEARFDIRKGCAKSSDRFAVKLLSHPGVSEDITPSSDIEVEVDEVTPSATGET